MWGLVSISEGAIVTGTGGGELECLDGEGEIMIIGIIHKKPEKAGLQQNGSLINQTCDKYFSGCTECCNRRALGDTPPPAQCTPQSSLSGSESRSEL